MEGVAGRGQGERASCERIEDWARTLNGYGIYLAVIGAAIWGLGLLAMVMSQQTVGFLWFGIGGGGLVSAALILFLFGTLLHIRAGLEKIAGER